MSFQIVYQEPLKHFRWLIKTHPKADPIELMKCAFNNGVMLAIDKYHPVGEGRCWLFGQLLNLDEDKLDPPLTAEDWSRGP